MSLPTIDPRLLEALQRASSLELFQLRTVVDRMLADPTRILAVRKNLHLGQTVRFMDGRDGSTRGGKVAKMTDTHVTLLEASTHQLLTVPYAAIEPPAATAHDATASPELPSAPRASRDDFRCGEKVAFEDKYLNTVVGTIVRINQRTATIDAGGGSSWRVGFALLRHVIDL